MFLFYLAWSMSTNSGRTPRLPPLGSSQPPLPSILVTSNANSGAGHASRYALRPLRRPVRPSSAGGKLQTHESFSTPLVQPATRLPLLPSIGVAAEKTSERGSVRRPVTAHASLSARATITGTQGFYISFFNFKFFLVPLRIAQLSSLIIVIS